MKRVIVISTSLRRGSNSKSRLAGTLFCGGVNEPREIEDNTKLQEAFEMGKRV